MMRSTCQNIPITVSLARASKGSALHIPIQVTAVSFTGIMAFVLSGRMSGMSTCGSTRILREGKIHPPHYPYNNKAHALPSWFRGDEHASPLLHAPRCHARAQGPRYVDGAPARAIVLSRCGNLLPSTQFLHAQAPCLLRARAAEGTSNNGRITLASIHTNKNLASGGDPSATTIDRHLRMRPCLRGRVRPLESLMRTDQR